MYKIIDIHTHTYPEAISEKAVTSLGNFYNFSVAGAGTYADLEDHAQKCGICGFLLFSVATNPHQVTKVNDSIAKLAALSRSRGYETVGFAGMHQDFDDFEGELSRIEALGLRGVKIHPDIQGVDIDDPKLCRLYALMEGRLPLYLHMGDERPQYRFSEPKKLAKIMRMFPKLEVVAAHLGGYKAWDEAVTYLAGMDNLWFDTSSALWAMTPQEAKRLIDVFGSDKVMFGTDYPVMFPEDEIKRLLAIDLTEQQREDIFYNNAKRFLKL